MVNGGASNPSEQLQLNLLDNALDFLLSAAEAVSRDEGLRSLKEAVLHLANGIELLVKARIAREHWSLIFSSIDQANYSKIADADFQSVDFAKALVRLEQIVGVPIDKSVSPHVDNLRKLRNRITHFTASLDSVQTKALVAKSMNFCIEFCEMQNMVSLEAEGKLGEIHINLKELQEFVDDRMRSIFEGSRHGLIWECPECWQEALVIDAGEADCRFCKRRFVPSELAIGNSEGYVEDCPECGSLSTFAFILYNNAGKWVCFSCGEGGEDYDYCIRCNQMTYFPDPEDANICSDCWSDMMGR